MTTMSTLRSAQRWVESHRTSGAVPSGRVGLPPSRLRTGGAHFKDDNDYVVSAVREVDRLVSLVGLNRDSRLLDFGCGAGRLGIGIAERLGDIALYHGLDVQPELIWWARRHVGRAGRFEFIHVDNVNARYNPAGVANSRIPLDGEAAYDVFYSYSVFSHMRLPDVRAYLAEAARLLRPGGYAVFTAFVEGDVPEDTENPVGYGPLTWRGDLHCVRFNREIFNDAVRRAGLDIVHFEYGDETDGQSFYVTKRAQSPHLAPGSDDEPCEAEKSA